MLKKILKTTLVTVAVTHALTALAADLQCARFNNKWRPVSKDAIQLAQTLRVSTCEGQRFKRAAQLLKSTIKKIDATTEAKRVVQATQDEELLKTLSKMN